ncbi:MAG: site-specific DNA-methyltransferase [Bacillota bacterium]|nr:site-specific DNA-methyltransferase [Bacillota bacterium]
MELYYRNKKSKDEILKLAEEIAIDTNISIESNTIVQGENFNILSILLKCGFKGKIDLIYIDPPFSTNLDFVVSQNRISTISKPKSGIVAYSDKLCDEEYIEYMRERIILMRELLSEQGSFYFHIDTKIGHYIKIILDEIFGKKNFINDITRKKSNPKNFERKAYGNEKDVIYFYAKNKGNHIWNDVRVSYSNVELDEKYYKTDANGRRYNTVPIHAPGESQGDTGREWKGMLPPEGRHWRTSPKELSILDAKGLIEWSANGNPRLKRFADEHQGKKIQDIWLDFKDYAYPDYPTQKNLEMLELIVKQSSNEDSIVLDAFAGSGTTLLAAKKNNRAFIGMDKEKYAIKVMENKLGDLDLISKNTTFLNLSE